MMHFLYNTGIRFYQFVIWVVSFRNPKAKKMVIQAGKSFEKIKKEVVPG